MTWDFQTRLAIGSFGLGAAAGGTAGAAYLSPNVRATMVAMSKAGGARSGSALVKTAQATQAGFRAGYATAKFGGKLAPPAGRFLGRGISIGASVGRFGFGVAKSPVGRFVVRKIILPVAVVSSIVGFGTGAYKGLQQSKTASSPREAVLAPIKGALRGFIGL